MEYGRMEFKNKSMATYFMLIGFSDVFWLNIFLCVLVCTAYLVTLLMNLLLLILQKHDPCLHTPMYFFLSHLSFLDICYTTSLVPKMLASTLTGDSSISFLGCATQLFFGLGMGTTECLLLAIMAYDRYVAICHPLRYHILMSRGICFLLAAICWVIGLMSSFLHTVFAFWSPFCRDRETRHFACEVQAVLKLSCADTHAHERWINATAVTLALCSFILILFSYVNIISAILRIQSSEGKSKLFSTCSSHLLVVSIFYGPIMSVYMRPISSYNPERERVIFLLYVIVAPMCNPLIYSIRNKEVNSAIRKAIGKTFHALSMD